jgi:hypothetical protein
MSEQKILPFVKNTITLLLIIIVIFIIFCFMKVFIYKSQSLMFDSNSDNDNDNDNNNNDNNNINPETIKYNIKYNIISLNKIIEDSKIYINEKFVNVTEDEITANLTILNTLLNNLNTFETVELVNISSTIEEVGRQRIINKEKILNLLTNIYMLRYLEIINKTNAVSYKEYLKYQNPKSNMFYKQYL